jgi:DNA-binding transcriptional MerR regulator
MNTKQYTIEELCLNSGIKRRTIRYYIQEGLLDPPAGRGRGGFYYDSHLERLHQIKSLQEKGMRLAAIREFFRNKGEESPRDRRDIWIRIPLMDGLEIHIRRETEEKKRTEIEDLIRVAKSIIGRRSHDNER